jgi:hypothetical protein
MDEQVSTVRLLSVHAAALREVISRSAGPAENNAVISPVCVEATVVALHAQLAKYHSASPIFV